MTSACWRVYLSLHKTWFLWLSISLFNSLEPSISPSRCSLVWSFKLSPTKLLNVLSYSSWATSYLKFFIIPSSLLADTKSQAPLATLYAASPKMGENSAFHSASSCFCLASSSRRLTSLSLLIAVFSFSTFFSSCSSRWRSATFSFLLLNDSFKPNEY